MAKTLKTPQSVRFTLSVFFRDDTGSTAIEYALIATLVSVLIIGAVTALGTTLLGLFNETAAATK